MQYALFKKITASCIIFPLSLLVCLSGLSAEETEDAAKWEGKFSAGYNLSRGNTDNSQITGSIELSRKREKTDEFNLKGDLYYSSADKETEAEKWYGMGRYAFSFGEAKRWYNFYKLEGERDRFAEVNYRLIPSGGLGYWMFDEPDLKLMAEVALGLEHTDYRKGKESTDELVLIPRGYFEKAIFVNSRVSQDFVIYPSLTDAGEYRFRSETKLTNPLNDRLAVNFSVIDEYNSDPPEDTKSNDIRFISSLSYTF